MANRSRGLICTFDSDFLAEVDGVDWDGIARDFLDTTHLRTALNQVSGVDTDAASRTRIASDICDWGTMRISLFHDANKRPPIDKQEETFTLTAPKQRGQAVAASMVGTAGLSDYSISWKLNEKVMATATLTWCGAVTFTPSA